MITYFSLHQLGLGDIMLPADAAQGDDGMARAEFTAPNLVSHAPKDGYGRVYYDAVACYDEKMHRVRIFATSIKWLEPGELVSVCASNNL